MAKQNYRSETMPERIQRMHYLYDNGPKPKHLDNRNIIDMENLGVKPKKFNHYDKSTYLSDRDQYQRTIQDDPNLKNTMTSNEIVLAEFTPKDIKAMDPKDRKFVRAAKAKKFRLLNEKKIEPKKEKTFESILDNIQKPLSPFRRQYANGGGVASASDDPLYKVYIKEIELGNLTPDIPFDKWRDQYEEIQLEGPLSKKNKDEPFNEIEQIILSSALEKIDNAFQGISGLVARQKLEGGGKIIKFSDYKKPRRGVREIDLASYFKVGQTIANLTESERDLVNELLRRSLGKNPK